MATWLAKKDKERGGQQQKERDWNDGEKTLKEDVGIRDGWVDGEQLSTAVLGTTMRTTEQDGF